MKLLPMALFLLAALPTLTLAQQRRLGPHVHGQAIVDLSIEHDELDIAVSLPGHDAVGFEHPPATAQERTAVSRTTATLHDASWLVPAAAAACTLQTAVVQPHGFDKAAESGGHADFDSRYRYTCAHMGQLDHINASLIGAFPSVHQVVVNLITASGSNRQTLDASVSRIDVTP
ncbi:ZrgA family zinc uptake protein [Dyella sp.]|uniref:ZrgA family zinc uptake protein n=1 Tax=Dyella sp. TaxID=1869338 RepID=UPI002ED2B1AD